MSSDSSDVGISVLNPGDVGQDLEPFIPFEEITEIARAVCPGREAELANVVRLVHTNFLRSEVTCLAAIIDVPGTQLVQWRRFADELSHPPSYMWSDHAYLDPPSQGLVEPGLSYPTRLLLSAAAPSEATFGRTRDELCEKYLFTDSDIETATRELGERALGFWKLPTLRESADWLTVADLEPLLAEAPVKKSWTKARKLDVLMDNCDHERILRLVESIYPWSLMEHLFIHHEILVPDGFHRAWATLTGHFLGKCGYRNRDWERSRETLSFVNPKKVELVVPPSIDDCDLCKKP